jgi:hypothetical protein
MGPLRAGVRIYRDPSTNEDSPGVWLSAGSEVVSERRAAEAGYRPGSVVPISAWNEPAAAERELLFCPDRASVQPGTTVSVVRMPEEVMKPLRGLDYPDSSPEAEAVLELVVERLRPFLASQDDLVVEGIRVQRGGLRTASTHSFPEGEAFIGLHVVHWHAGRYGCRDHAQLSINLAPRDRFLVFLNVPVDELARDFGDPASGWLTIGRDFAQRCGQYPLVRVRIRPGEAFIAPMENLVHDISLEGSPLTDVSFSLRGRCRLPT